MINNSDNEIYRKKIDTLIQNFALMRKVLVSFSGGVDSSLVASIAYRALGMNAIAVTVDSPLLPLGEKNSAKRIASEIGLEHVILKLNELNIPDFVDNPPNRCYLCKKYRYEKIREKAREYNTEYVVDGTSASDLYEYRPGLKAAEDLHILSPLLDEGISKLEARIMSNLLGLSTASKPASPCLATRFPYGHRLAIEKLRRVDRAEKLLFNLIGAVEFRVRDHDSLARIELDTDGIAAFSDPTFRRQITQGLKSLGFHFVTLDLEGYRSGCFDESFLSETEKYDS